MRSARSPEANLPKQDGFWRGEPTSYEGAHATESAPQRTVEVGGQSPGAERRAAPLWVGRASSPMMRQQHKMRTSQTIRTAALAEGSRALHGAPEDGPHRPLEERSDERQAKIGRLGVQPNQYGAVGDSQPPEWRPYGAYLCAQNSTFFTVRSHHGILIMDVI